MKFYKKIIAAFFLIGCTNLMIAEELPLIKYTPQDVRHAKEVSLSQEDLQKLYAKPSDRLLAVDFTTFDTLANALSYCGSSTTPFVYDPTYGYLVTIKRGSREVTDVDWSRLNSKNNLFLRVSSDNGYTWQPQVLVYDELESQVGSGRYPSCATFTYDGAFAVAFSGSLVNEGASLWLGQVMGLWTENGDLGTVSSPKCIANGTVYDWGVADAVVYGYTNASNQAVIIAADVVSSTNNDLADNGNIGIRKTVDIDVPETWIPDAWRSSLFYPVDDIRFRPNEVIGLRQKSFDPNSPLYLGVLGNFKVTPDYEKAKLGFSISNDNGDTWQPFVIMDVDLLRNYTASLGIDPENSAILYDSKDFTVLSNGDVYFVAHFREIDDAKPFNQLINHLIEVKYSAQNQSWSITKVADITGLSLNLLDETSASVGSPTDIEIQIAKTVDESKLFVKWVEMLDVTWITDSTYQFRTNDIFYSVKQLDAASGWSEPVNLTESDEYDRQTNIAPIVPNSLENIPILKLQTIFNLANNEVPGTQEYLLAMRRYLNKQEVQIAHFNAVVGVNDYEPQYSATEINRIYPNPAQSSTTLEYSVKGFANIEVAIYDLIGNKLKNIFTGAQSEGVYSFEIDTKDMLSGTYYISLKNGDKTISKILNIVK